MDGIVLKEAIETMQDCLDHNLKHEDQKTIDACQTIICQSIIDYAKKDAENLGISLSLLNEFETIMSSIWALLAKWRHVNPLSNLTHKENVIYFIKKVPGKAVKIECFFVNKEHIDLKISTELGMEITFSKANIIPRITLYQMLVDILNQDVLYLKI